MTMFIVNETLWLLIVIIASIKLGVLLLLTDFLIVTHVVLELVSCEVHTSEDCKVDVESTWELEVSFGELSECLGLIGVSSEEEGETTDHKVATNEG
jgi:hypothetical protein